MEAGILELIGLIGMSSPLHDVVIRFQSNPRLTFPGLASTLKEILAAYYECQGLDFPRKVDILTISYDLGEGPLVFNTGSHSVPPSEPKSNLRFQFDGAYLLPKDRIVEEIFLLFPLDGVREFAAIGLVINADGYRRMFQKMKDLSHLRLDNVDISPVLDALSLWGPGSSQAVTKTVPIYPHTHRWRICPEVGVVNPIEP